MDRQVPSGGRAHGPPYGFTPGGFQYAKQQDFGPSYRQAKGFPDQLQDQGPSFHNELLLRQQLSSLHKQSSLHQQGPFHLQPQGSRQTQQGPVNLQQQGSLHPLQQGTLHLQQQGALRSSSQEALHPPPQGPLRPSSQEVLHPPPQGALHPPTQGTLRLQQQGAPHPPTQGSLHLQQQGASLPQQRGLSLQQEQRAPFLQTPQRGPFHLQSQGTPSQQQQPPGPSFQGGPHASTFKDSLTRGPPCLPQGPSEQSYSPSFLKPQPPDPKAQVQTGIYSEQNARQQPLQGQPRGPTNQHEQLQGRYSSKQALEVSFLNPYSGQPTALQDPFRQPQRSPFLQVEHQAGPLQSSKHFPHLPIPDSHGSTRASPHAARSVSPGQGIPPFFASEHLLSACQSQSSSSALPPKRDVNCPVTQATAFSGVPHFLRLGSTLPPVTSMDMGLTRPNLGNPQDLQRAIAGGPAMQSFSGTSGQRDSAQEMNKVQMQRIPPHSQPANMQVPGNREFRQPDDISFKSSSQFSNANRAQQSEDISFKSNSQFSNANRALQFEDISFKSISRFSNANRALQSEDISFKSNSQFSNANRAQQSEDISFKSNSQFSNANRAQQSEDISFKSISQFSNANRALQSEDISFKSNSQFSNANRAPQSEDISFKSNSQFSNANRAQQSEDISFKSNSQFSNANRAQQSEDISFKSISQFSNANRALQSEDISFKSNSQFSNANRAQQSEDISFKSNSQFSNANRAQQSEDISFKSNSQFSNANRVHLQVLPPIPHQARTPDQRSCQSPFSDKQIQSNHLIPQPTRAPVQGSLTGIGSHAAQVPGNPTFTNLGVPSVIGNSSLPPLNMTQIKNTFSFSSSAHGPLPVGPLLSPQDRVHMQTNLPLSLTVQSNGPPTQDGHPVAHPGEALTRFANSFNNLNSDSAQGNHSLYRFQMPPVQSGPSIPHAARPPPSSGPQLPPPSGMPPTMLVRPLPPVDTSTIQAGPPLTIPNMPPVPWPMNAELFHKLCAPPVLNVDNQHLLAAKEASNELANRVLDESEQRKQDVLWLSRFLASRRPAPKPCVKVVKSPPIAEARELVYGARKLVSELRMVCQMLQDNAEDEAVWSELYLQATNISKELQDQMKALNRPGYLEGLKKKMEKIRKKRLRIQREKQETPAKKEEKARAAEREAKIDKWRMKQIREVDEKKREREVKAAADSVLSEVLKKQGDTKRMVLVLRALEKLRKLRKEAAARKGVSPLASADETFENHIKRLRVLIKERTVLYDAEERALRVMLEGEQEEERNRERERKQRKERERLLNLQREIDTILFGEPEELPPDDPLQPFRQFYQLTEHSLPALIQIRTEWDRCLVTTDHPGGSCIPPGWVLAGPPTNDVWASAVKQTD